MYIMVLVNTAIVFKFIVYTRCNARKPETILSKRYPSSIFNVSVVENSIPVVVFAFTVNL